MNRKAEVFPCLVCARDTGCVNRLVRARCRQAAAQARARRVDKRRVNRLLAANAERTL
jgi:hypothetical protein